jgi:hypothetical protein
MGLELLLYLTKRSDIEGIERTHSEAAAPILGKCTFKRLPLAARCLFKEGTRP